LNAHKFSVCIITLHFLYFSVGSPPKLLSEPEKKYVVREGKTVKLTCTATGWNDPDSNRTLSVWMKLRDGKSPLIIRRKELRFKVKTGKHLEILNVQKQDAGRYKCRCQNQYGYVNAFMDLEG